MFKDFLTIEGERLLAKSIAGTATITFTKMEIGDGDQGTSTKAITSLANSRMTLDIYSVLLSGDNNIEITTMLDSSAIQEGFYLREKGIYATDGTTEILFMYGNAGSLAEWIEYLSNAVFTRTIRTIVTLSESDNVNITIQKGAYASGEDAENILTAIQNIKLDGDWAKYSQAESILSILDTFVAAYTVARAGKLDNLDAKISSRAPASTALSNDIWTNTRATAIDTINTNAGRLTAARAGYIDYLASSTYGLPVIKAYVDTLENNVGNTKDSGGSTTAGTIMAKLNALQTQVNALKSMCGYYKPSNNLRYTFVSSEISTDAYSDALKLGGFYAQKSGCIRVIASLKTDGYYACLFTPKFCSGSSNTANEYAGTPCVTYSNFYNIENNTEKIQYVTAESNYAVTEIAKVSNTDAYESIDKTMWVERGEYVAFYLAPNKNGNIVYCNSLKVYYDEAY